MPDHSTQLVIDELTSMFDRLDELAPPVRIDELAHRAGHNTDPTRGNRAPWGERRWRRRLASVAAVSIAATGLAGLWWTIERDTGPNVVVPADTLAPSRVSSPIDETTTSTPPSDPTVQLPTESRGPSAIPSVVDEIAAADAWTAARQFQVDAQYQASPAEAADLAIANELASRACYARQGVALAPFDADRLDEWFRYWQDRWDARRRIWTPDGQQSVREQGNTIFRSAFGDPPDLYPHAKAPAPPECQPAATSVTGLGGIAVASEEQLQSLFENGDLTGDPAAGAFGRLPGTEHLKLDVDRCVVARGWDEWNTAGAYQYLFEQASVSATEIDLMNDVIDCYNELDAPAIYLTASIDYVDDFRREFADNLEAIANDRAGDLAEAYEILRTAGLTPLSDEGQ